MISSLYNREDGVKPGHCVATANEPNTICPSASALGGDEFGCVPYTVIGGRSVNGVEAKSDEVRLKRWPSFNKEEFITGFMQNIFLIFTTYFTWPKSLSLTLDAWAGRRGPVNCIIM